MNSDRPSLPMSKRPLGAKFASAKIVGLHCRWLPAHRDGESFAARLIVIFQRARQVGLGCACRVGPAIAVWNITISRAAKLHHRDGAGSHLQWRNPRSLALANFAPSGLLLIVAMDDPSSWLPSTFRFVFALRPTGIWRR